MAGLRCTTLKYIREQFLLDDEISTLLDLINLPHHKKSQHYWVFFTLLEAYMHAGVCSLDLVTYIQDAELKTSGVPPMWNDFVSAVFHRTLFASGITWLD